MKLTTMISRFLILLKKTSRLHFNDQNFFKSKIIVFEIKGGMSKTTISDYNSGDQEQFFEKFLFL